MAKQDNKFMPMGFILCVLLNPALLNASAPHHSYGFLELHAQNQTTLEHSGMINIEKSTLSQTTTINGFVAAKHSTFEHLTVNGDADLDQVTVTGKTIIHGKINTDDSTFEDVISIHGQVSAEDSQFKKEITIYGNHSEFENCALTDILIEKTSDQKTLHLYLEETTVSGNVTFLSPGVIHMDKESKIAGRVTGATIQ
ncbi:hypothetical protein CC99x_005180 [Candidatus Berkiella cookevillensis]|uniref:Polymer-forming cytoskeletal n=1 Tax=Candidatus Berkiella cookevillensis TaxID=437022 RepID=A0A0Q9YU41_9GAMM|nr:hypothetical protein [Candidatus Berkiella cookevillensis]MCS5708293.1 hypothetical protein [Candidatus Berkiella cookevillensis]